MPSNNNRIDDPNEADIYLTQWKTDPSGRQEQISNKKGQESHSIADITQDGDYSVCQINENGDRSDLFQGSHKFYADSRTVSIAKGSDSVADNTYEKHQNGKLTESGGGNFHAVDGHNAEISSENKQTFSTDGHGQVVFQGDTTFVANSGRIDNYGEKGYSIQSGKEVIVNSTQDVAFYVGTNEGHIVNANLSFDSLGSAYMNSKGQLNFSGTTDVTLACGSAFTIGGAGVATALSAPAGIIMTPASIIFKVGASQITMTAAGIIINAPLISTTSSGPTTIIGSTVAIL
jgi:hypothetical protein